MNRLKEMLHSDLKHAFRYSFIVTHHGQGFHMNLKVIDLLLSLFIQTSLLMLICIFSHFAMLAPHLSSTSNQQALYFHEGYAI